MYMCSKAVPVHKCTQKPCYFHVNTHDHTSSDQLIMFLIMMLSSKECLYLMSVQFARISVVPHPLCYWPYSPVISTWIHELFVVCCLFIYVVVVVLWIWLYRADAQVILCTFNILVMWKSHDQYIEPESIPYDWHVSWFHGYHVLCISSSHYA